LIKVRQAYAAATASQRRLQREKDQVEAVASNWYNRAQLALKSSHEGLAREALARRQAALAKADTLQGQMDRQGVAVEKLYVAMHALEAKIREAASTKEQLIARARTAQTTLQVNDMLSGLTGKTAVDAFDRMAKKVEALEAVAEASGEMNLLPLGKAESSLEADFLLLEQSSAVDQELKRMKSNMSETRMLGAATSTEGELRKPVRIPVTQGEKLYIR
jgi:phage shock protein A